MHFLNHCLRFHWVTFMEVGFHSYKKAKGSRDIRKLNLPVPSGNYSEGVCHSKKKKKKRAHLVPLFLYPVGFLPKMKKLQQTFLEILLMQENLGYKPLKSLSHDQVFNAIVLKSLVIHKQAIRFSPTSFFSSTHSPHPQSSRTLRVSPL